MTTAPDPSPASSNPLEAPATNPPPVSQPPPARSAIGAFFAGLGRIVFAVSTLANLAVLVLIAGLLLFLLSTFSGPQQGEESLQEHFYAGDKKAEDKIAIIRIEGVLFEGLTSYAVEQIDAAAADAHVKAVVLRINSPGGSITASDDLHRRLNELRRGKNAKHPGTAKPVVVSMGSIAASGGYYIAMIESETPTLIFAEPATMTGAIGVYAAFPNVKKLGDDYGVHVNIIKAGDIKASASPFHKMTAEEERVWQHMIDDAYLRFLEVIARARKSHFTVDRLQDDVSIVETIPVRKGAARKKHLNYKRYLADGGIWTARQARKWKLVDRIGYLGDAIEEASRLADLGPEYKAITYRRKPTLLRSILGIQSIKPPLQLDSDSLSSALAPRLWCLAPQHELAGAAAALGRLRGLGQVSAAR